MKTGGRRVPLHRAVLRGAIVLVVDALALLLLAAVLPGFDLEGFGAALLMAVVVGVLNALVWPLIVRFALPLTVATLGLGALVLNGVIVAVAASIDFGASVDDVFSGVVVALGFTLVTAVADTLLSIDDDQRWHHDVVRRQARRRGDARESDVPGIVFLEIDGLAHGVIRRAVRDGNAPELARWIHAGSHRLEQWETDWSSQTGACQAGLLHGNNDDMPAFRWWEKDRGRAIVTNHPKDAAELERRHSDGRGLLHEDGASRANILSGDAPHSMLTMSTVLDVRRGKLGSDYFAYFAQPSSVARTLWLVIGEVIAERFHATVQRRRGVEPRVARSRTYAVVRAWATVVQLDLQVAAVVADVLAGRPVIYSTFLAYDEVAHHSGVERPDTLAVLRRVDGRIGRIAAALDAAARPYHVVVLSDHGQSQGATFEDRFGVSLEEVVRSATGAADVQADEASDHAGMYLNASLTELAGGQGAVARTVRSATGGRRVDGAVELGREHRTELERARGGGSLPDLSVMASGCLGLISFPREPGRVPLERLTELYPRLLPALREHPGIGFVLVRSERDGAVVLGPRGMRFLDRDDEVEGEDPLAPFGPNAADHVRRTDRFAHCPDVLVNSTYWAETDEVAAFEHLVGSHGGMGGGQSHPFVLFPAAWHYPEEPVVGAEALHGLMRGWLVDLGHPAYRRPMVGRAPLPGAEPDALMDAKTERSGHGR
jgi:uncharacterized membrane protein YvlD (DUF360 family)